MMDLPTRPRMPGESANFEREGKNMDNTPIIEKSQSGERGDSVGNIINVLNSKSNTRSKFDRVCSRCKEPKKKNEFYRRNSTSYLNWCKVCHRKLTSARNAYNGPLKRSARLIKSYGITSEQFDTMESAQGGVCFICKNKCGKGRLSVDHCHKTGKVRSLLCRHCNLMIGLANDNPDVLAQAAEYLRSHAHA